MTVKLKNNKGKKIKCKFCKELIFFTEENVMTNEKKERYVICDSCDMEIKLKRL